MISACGLLDASFRESSLDYVDLIKATRLLCGVNDAKQLVKRMLFNYIMVNQDDHSKNFSFLADDEDNWQISPCYDIVYSPSPYEEHMTAFNGNGRFPDKEALKIIAAQAGFNDVKPVNQMIGEVAEVAMSFGAGAKRVGVSNTLITTIMADIKKRISAIS